MATFFTILFLISLIFLIWGAISPSSLSKKSEKSFTRRDAVTGFGIIAFVLFILIGVTAPQPPKDVTIQNTSANKTAVLDEQTEKEPVVTTQTTTETAPVPFQKTSVNDAMRTQGTSAVTTVGVNGLKTFTYELTFTDGKQTGKKLLTEEVTTQPVNEITSVGTKAPVKPKAAPAPAPAPPVNSTSCDPNYAGACVPIASDVDCGGGSGNGPAYVYGTVRVIGVDIYELDRDGNGYGCE